MKQKISVVILAQVAVLLAMEVMLSRFFSIATPVTKFSFAFVPLAICGALFGPVYGGIMGGLADLLGAILFPIGPYFPGYTLNNALHGVALGVALKEGRADYAVLPIENSSTCWPWCLTMWWWAFSWPLYGGICSQATPTGQWLGLGWCRLR